MIVPVFRIFDYAKAVEFYVDWLGFTIDWEHRPENTPLYMRISLNHIVIHLTGHHGDCSPGARVIAEFSGLADYHAILISKNYRFNRPALEKPEWDPKAICMEVVDPFMNKIVFKEVVG